MIRPTQRCALLFILGVPIALVCGVMIPSLWIVWSGTLAGSLVAFFVDGILALKTRSFQVDLECPDQMFIGDTKQAATLSFVFNRSTRVRIEGRFEHSDIISLQETIFRVEINDEKHVSYRAAVSPRRRGQALIHNLWLRWCGPLGLASRCTKINYDRTIAIVPNVRVVQTKAIDLFTDDSLAGIKKRHEERSRV